MRRCIKLLLIVLILTGLFSCKKSLDVNAPWQEITIVYGILNQSDTIHYIKITKAFLGPGNALDYAKIADSSNYRPPLQVSLNEYSGTQMLRSLALKDTVITDKDSGLFYFPDQKVYYTRSQLNPANSYKLRIVNTHTGKQLESDTRLISDFAMSKPDYFYGVSFVPGKSSIVQWVSPLGGKRYQLTITIQYSELLHGDSAKTIHYLNWTIFKEVKSLTDKGGQTMSYGIAGEDFYKFLSLNLVANPDIARSVGACKYNFLVGSDNLDSYMMVSPVSNTVVQTRIPFTNIVNGIGLFASRHSVTFDSLWFSNVTKDSLKTNRYTKDLGF